MDRRVAGDGHETQAFVAATGSGFVCVVAGSSRVAEATDERGHRNATAAKHRQDPQHGERPSPTCGAPQRNEQSDCNAGCEQHSEMGECLVLSLNPLVERQQHPADDDRNERGWGRMGGGQVRPGPKDDHDLGVDTACHVSRRKGHGATLLTATPERQTDPLSPLERSTEVSRPHPLHGARPPPQPPFPDN